MAKTKTFAKTLKTSVKFKVGNMDYKVLELPEGLRCVRIDAGGTMGKFFLDEFPKELFPSNSFILHDATHYGIVLEPEQVELI